jgi:hypothetical protein
MALLSEADRDHLQQWATVNVKDWLAASGKSRDAFEREEAKELKAIIDAGPSLSAKSP